MFIPKVVSFTNLCSILKWKKVVWITICNKRNYILLCVLLASCVFDPSSGLFGCESLPELTAFSTQVFSNAFQITNDVIGQ